MVFGEPYWAEGFPQSIRELGVPVRPADLSEVALVREQVRTLIDFHQPPMRVALIEGQLHRGFLWYALSETEATLEHSGFHVQFQEDVYIMGDDPRTPTYIASAADLQGQEFHGIDLYITPVARRDWVWISTHDALGPFFLTYPEDPNDDAKWAL
jgi:hypothetical protein